MDETMSKEKPEPIWTLRGLLFQAHPWHGISPGNRCPEVLTTYIEIVPSDTVKFELDKITGHLKINRPQRYSNVCPVLYGLIPRTFCGDKLTYKMGPDATHGNCEITHVYGRGEAHEVIRRCHEDYESRFGSIEGLLTAALRG